MRVLRQCFAVVLCISIGACSKDDNATPGDSAPAGLWYPVRGTDQASPDAMSELANLPYLRGSHSASAASAVTVNDADATCGGLNLAVSGHACEAVLIDMNGNVLHTWRAPLAAVEPGDRVADDGGGAAYWRRVHLYPNGDLLVMFQGAALAKIDKESHVLWCHDGPVAGDFAVAPDGTIYALENDGGETFITVIGPDGDQRSRTSIGAALRNSEYAELLAATKGDGPATTASAIEVLDGRLSQSLPAWRAGNVLVALPELSAIAVVDPKAASVAWLHRGIRALRSQPMVLASGKLLLFDSPQPDAMSRVVELDPVTEELGWTYQGKADAPLASYRIGSCQRLPNGNTLIVESEAGRAFEVTSGGELVWEYFNPHLTPEGDFIAGLCEVERIDTSYVADAFPAVAAALDDAGKVIDTGAVESLLNHK